MSMFALDFESHYDPKAGYALGKMPTMQYIRDARWQCLGCAVRGQGWDEYAPPDVLPQLFDQVTWGQTTAIAHNALFDGAVLAERYGHRPKGWVDTAMVAKYAISQGWAPADARTNLAWWGDHYGVPKGDTRAAVDAGGEALAEYAMRDVDIMLRILQEYLPRVPTMERELMDLHVRMAAEPVLALDTDKLQQAADTTPPEASVKLRKAKVFAEALRALGVEPERKVSPRTGRPAYAFAKKDAFMQRLATHRDPRIRKLHALRCGGTSNLLVQRAARFLAVGEPLPVPLWYYGGHTGRASGADKLNLQNMPRKGPLRESVMAPPGHKLIVVDLAQIEVRVLAWLAGEEWLLGAFRQGADVYRVFASRYLFPGTAYDAVTDEQRRIAKAAVLALGFGQGANGFQEYCRIFGIEITHRRAQEVVTVYRQAHPNVVALWGRCMDSVLRYGYQELPTGRRLTYPDMENEGREVFFHRHQVFSKQYVGKRDRIKLWPGLLTENLVQALARDVVMHQTLTLHRAGLKVALSVHDEAVLVVRDDEVPGAREFVDRTFATAPEWAPGLPVQGESHVVERYAEAK